MALTIPTRIYSQYRGKPRAVAWYNITRTIGGQFADVFQDIRTSYNIDTATTDELNVIGRIVVIDRGFEVRLFSTRSGGVVVHAGAARESVT